MRLILASESPRRRELLKRLGVPFETRSVHTREFADGELPAEQLPRRNAEAKALAAAAEYPDALIIGADTVILFEGRVIGKPATLREAKRTLLSLSGRTHEVVTGVALVRAADRLRIVWEERTSVTFKKLTEDTVDEYLAVVDVLDKAGSYALQEHGDMLIAEVDGDLDNVVGLPLDRLSEELDRLVR